MKYNEIYCKHCNELILPRDTDHNLCNVCLSNYIEANNAPPKKEEDEIIIPNEDKREEQSPMKSGGIICWSN